MKKLIKLNLVLAVALTSLSAEIMINPLGSAFKSTDNGGTLSAIDAYKDGIGVFVLDNLGAGIQVNNTAMNTLVYTYGDAAKANNTTIVNQVINGTGTVADKALAGSLTTNGQSCNDNNIMTVNDIYTTGVCAGTLTVNGQTCNDGNPATSGETWLNGLCQGGLLALITDLSQIPNSSKANITLIDSLSGWGSNYGVFLFDKKLNGETSDFYWYSGFLTITVDSNFRIWSYETSSAYINYDASLTFLNLNTGLYIPNTIVKKLRTLNTWELSSSIIPAGTYKIRPAPDSTVGADNRMDSEIFIEKVN